MLERDIHLPILIALLCTFRIDADQKKQKLERGPKTTSASQHTPVTHTNNCSQQQQQQQQQQQYNQIIKIYTEWGNHYLEKARFKRLIQNLQIDLSDGVLLADVVEAVCGQKVPDINKKPKSATNMTRLENLPLHMRDAVVCSLMTVKTFHQQHGKTISPNKLPHFCRNKSSKPRSSSVFGSPGDGRCSLFFGNRRDVPLGRLGDPLTQLSTTCSFPIQPVPLRSLFTCSYENLCEKERITEYLVPLYPHHLLPATVSAGYAFDVCMSAVPHFPDWYFVSGWKLLQQQQPGIPHQWFILNGLSSNLRLFFCLDFFPRRCRRL
ncbi:hypothetical protein V9T40_007269 [Parthenolecanium corni]|uniref:Calponin-homology (CH) domain-containing protein n=1 Tax=Parthenolecanium corni TaxID=536013 RepID=A0AAN9TW15_9HEMI